MDSERPKIALFAFQNAEVLQLLSGLSDAYRVRLVSPSEDIIRVHRAQRFELVLFYARARDVRRFAGLSRRLKTEQKAPQVCLLCAAGVRGDPVSLLEAHLLDGLYGGVDESEKILGWIDRVRRAERPIEGEFGAPGKLRAALRKISGFRASSTDE